MFASANPKEPFYVANEVELDSERLKVLTRLYQPIIGIFGVGLYMTLMNEFDTVPLSSDYKTLYQLQDQTNSTLKDLFDNLHRLEGIGLVKTFVGTNPILGEVIIFRLQKVPTAREFFGTFLLSSLLLERIGAPAYKRLVNEFTPRDVLNMKDTEEVTSDFFEVFHLSAQKAIEPEAEVKEAYQKVGSQPQRTLKAAKGPKNKIDWQFLIDSFSVYDINKTEIELHKNEIYQIMNFYDLSELQFVDAAIPTLSAVDQKLDMRAIQISADEKFNSEHNAKFISDQMQSAQKEKEENNVAAPKLSEDEQKLAKEMAEARPVDFLHELKRAQGQITTSNERRVAYQLENDYGLMREMVNAVIYAAVKSRMTLYLSSAENIIKDWNRRKITTAAEAIVRVREHEQEKQTKKTQHQEKSKQAGNYRSKKPRLTQGVDWDNYHPKNESKIPKMSQEEIDKIFHKYGKESDK